MAEEIFGEAFAASAGVGGDGFFAIIVDVEAGVFPGEQVGEFSGADELGFARSLGCDAHRDDATSDSFVWHRSSPMNSLILVLNLGSCRLGSLDGFR
jgi:hypothetical protein